MFIRKVIREKRIPFEIDGSFDTFYSEKNIAWLNDSFNQLENGKVIVKSMEELVAME
jgi:DNA-damage-inducible protein J